MTRTDQIFDDRYRLDERIAAGSVGQVWRATDLLLKRPVAVKVLRPEYADHPETLARFRKEAEHAGALRHPSVAQVHDYGDSAAGGPPYLVMELVDGSSLAALLTAGPLGPADALDVIAQAARGLHAAHLAGLVHRDVKPANLLIGAGGQVKITDFGIAHVAGQTPVTGPGLVLGTTLYMAPERISGGPGTPASDLYSLGIVLHECLTGMPPYSGSPTEVMASHLYLPLPPLPAGVPPELDALVARLTAKDPSRRSSDASELAAAAARLRDSITAEEARRARRREPDRPPVPEAGRAGPAGRADSMATARTRDTGGYQAGERLSHAEREHGPQAARERRTAGGHLAQPAPPEARTPVRSARGTQPALGTQPARGAHSRQPARRAHRRTGRSRRQVAGIAAGAALLTGVGLAGLLASGVLHATPVVVHSPGSPSSAGTPQFAVLPPANAGTPTRSGGSPSATANSTPTGSPQTPSGPMSPTPGSTLTA